MNYIMIDDDMWENAGKKYSLVKLERRPGSTATELTLEYNGETLHKVVPYHTIHFIEDEEN